MAVRSFSKTSTHANGFCKGSLKRFKSRPTILSTKSRFHSTVMWPVLRRPGKACTTGAAQLKRPGKEWTTGAILQGCALLLP